MPPCPHHVTQRGNQGRDFFFTASDCAVELGLLKHYCQIHSVDLLGFCLIDQPTPLSTQVL
jgi:hypothetical protein